VNFTTTITTATYRDTQKNEILGIKRFAKWYLRYHDREHSQEEEGLAESSDSESCAPKDTYVIGVQDGMKARFREMCMTLGTACHFVEETKIIQETAPKISNALGRIVRFHAQPIFILRYRA